MSNLQQVDWQTIRAASVVGLAGSYVVLPTFSYAAPFIGASEIVVQFGYSVARKFTLKSLPEKPTDATYCLCIRYRVGETVFRYKLWDGVGEVMTGVELYNGQLIRQNFVFEVWNTANSATQVNAAEVTLLTSLGSIPTDYRNVAATSASSSTLIYPLAQDNNYPLITDGLLMHFRAEDINVGYTQWGDNVGGVMLDTVNAPNPPIIEEDALNGFNVFNFTDIDVALRQTTTSNYPTVFGFMFVKPADITSLGAIGSSLLSFVDTGTTKYSGVKVGATAGKLSAYNEASASSQVDALENNWQVVKFTMQWNGALRAVTIGVDDTDGTLGNTAALPVANRLEIGRAGESTVMRVAELLVYNDPLVDETAVKRYLNAKFGVAIALPIVFPDGSAWDDNNV